MKSCAEGGMFGKQMNSEGAGKGSQTHFSSWVTEATRNDGYEPIGMGANPASGAPLSK